MDIEGLKKFCAVGTSYHHLNHPFSDSKYSYATNGHMIVRVPKIEEITDQKPEVINIKRIFSGIDISKHNDLPKWQEPEKQKCNLCKGFKKIETCPECDNEEGLILFNSSHNWYEVECKTCRGNGVIPGGKTSCGRCDGTGMVYVDPYAMVDFGQMGISIKLLEKIKDLPAVKIGAMAEGLVHFSFAGGDGAIMGMQK